MAPKKPDPISDKARSLEAELRRAAAGDAAHGGEDAQLMRERQSAQQGMIAQLRAALGGATNRPVQPLGARTIEELSP